jgi:hypothetical protein
VKIDASMKLRGASAVGTQQLNTLKYKCGHAVAGARQGVSCSEEGDQALWRGAAHAEPRLAVADALKPAPVDAKRPRGAKELSVDAMIDEECERITIDFAAATRAHAKAQAEWKTR